LQDSAGWYIQQFPDLIRIGITGSFGKTTTKEILASILSGAYPTIYNQGNLNSETGLPLSIFHITRAHKIGIFELGMNRPGEIKETAAVLNPHYALITNIGSAHIAFFGSKKRIAEEKKQIFSRLTSKDVAIIPGDSEFADFLVEGIEGLTARVIRYGDFSKAGVTDIEDKGLGGTVFNYEGKPLRFPLPGKFNLRNALAAITLARDLGLDAETIRAGLEKVRPLFGRSETLSGSITVIQDCYNASPDTMSAALSFFQGIDCPGKKVLVLGDMLELGDESAVEHKKIITQAFKTGTGLILLLGRNMAEAAVTLGIVGEPGSGGFRHQTIDPKTLKLATLFGENAANSVDVYVFEGTDDGDVAQAADVLNTFLQKGDLLLIKASRGLAMERITERLQGLTEYDQNHGRRNG
jgi:UDP-N-acetylmuramoyl-tripeptide--D-alanyl-D-alanine ligase